MKRKHLIPILLEGLLGIACTTRVSEWILLNALPRQYSLVYFHGFPLPGSLEAENRALAERIEAANIRFKTVRREGIDTPFYGLYYENRLFSTYRSIPQLEGLTTSPLREKIAAELMAGKLCVMVYLRTDDPEKDDRGLQTLHSAVASSPFGSIITVYELSRNNLEEHHFASMLLHVEDDLRVIQEPMVFGIFGRFKALEPLLGKGISEENIHLMIDFFTAECSCLIKENLPGTDILFTDRWENPEPAMLNAIIDSNPALSSR